VLATIGQFSTGDGRRETKNDSSKPKQLREALKVGNLAPPLKAARWLQGDPVPSFEPGKVYIVEFWATWCSSCIGKMPPLADLQARYKNQGVTAIAFTCRDIRGTPGHTEEKVTLFVKKRGPMFRFTFAYADDDETASTWLRGQDYFGSFVVDKAGRIPFTGNPMFPPVVLPKILAVNGAATAIGEELAKLETDHQKVVAALEQDAAVGLNVLKEFDAKYPALADTLPVSAIKLRELLKAGNEAVATQYAEILVEKAINHNNVFMLNLVYLLLHDKRESKALHSLFMRAAEARVAIDGGTDPQSLFRLADAYRIHGEKRKAKQFAAKAIAVAGEESADYRQEVEKQVRETGIEP
jgi:thiol-disulfide isomerase/thioredoxin